MTASSADDCEDNAQFSRVSDNRPGRCYSYQVLDRLCVTLKYTEHSETASYTWDYAGGCFEDKGYGSHVQYIPAEVGTRHKF